ncbi:MAG: hypothetical protein WDO15_13180 [Bacteroidota bacterium]
MFETVALHHFQFDRNKIVRKLDLDLVLRNKKRSYVENVPVL